MLSFFEVANRPTVGRLARGLTSRQENGIVIMVLEVGQAFNAHI